MTNTMSARLTDESRKSVSILLHRRDRGQILTYRIVNMNSEEEGEKENFKR
jgi:hypothetical protein